MIIFSLYSVSENNFDIFLSVKEINSLFTQGIDSRTNFISTNYSCSSAECDYEAVYFVFQKRQYFLFLCQNLNLHMSKSEDYILITLW